MSTVTITDSQEVELPELSAIPNPLSAIGKYGQTQDFHLVLPKEMIEALNKPLKKEAATPASLGIKLGRSYKFGTDKPQFSIGPEATAAVRVNAKKDSDLFSDDLYKSQITVKDGEGFLSLALTGSVSGSESQSKGSQSDGDMTLGFQAGASATFEFFKRFSVDDDTPKIAQALSRVVSEFVMPVHVTDLRALQPGDVATWSGKRNLKVSGDFSASVSAVPLASPTLPVADHPVQLNASAKIDVTACYEITSNWQIRSRALSDGVVELGVYKARGSDWDLALTASAGMIVCLGSKDLLTELIDKLSKKPEADKQQLAAAGLLPDDIKAINAAISKSLDHSIHASLSLDLNGLDSDEAAFLYRIELNKLDEKTAAAVTAMLDGDLTAIDQLNPQAEENGIAGPGVTLLRNIFTRTKKTGTAVKMNFVGLLNFASLSDFVSKSQVIHEPAGGDVVFKETASGDRIEVLTTPQAQEKLRKLIFDSILTTTTFRCAGALENMEMDCSAVHFALHSTTNEHTMSDYLDWFVALGLLTAQGKAEIMKQFRGTGASTCTARVAFNDAACQAMYLDRDGQARPAGDYTLIGRNALPQLLMPPPGDQNDTDRYRREVLGNEKIWAQFAGQTSIGPVLQKEYGWHLDDSRIPYLRDDYSVIVWWANAMSSTAAKIVAMRNFLKTADPATLKTNKDFLAMKEDIRTHLLGVINNSPMTFNLPFGLVALAWAAGPAAVSSGILHSPSINREFGAVAAAQHA